MATGRQASGRKALGLAGSLCLTLLALACSQAQPAAAATSRAAAGPMLGVVAQTDSISVRDTRRLRQAGVDTVRFIVPWGRVEPRVGTFRWRFLDRRVLAAARAGAVPTAMVFGAPDQFGPGAPPPTASAAELSAWLDFLAALVHRYGPGGELLATHPGTAPVRRWQIWNEPNLTAFWGGASPEPGEYVRLLDASSERIRALDPAATIVSAGLSPAAQGLDPLRFLAGMYDRWEALGADPSFDELALHPYANSVAASRRAIERAIALARRRQGEAPPISIAEIAWGSAGRPGMLLAGSPQSQADKLNRALDLFERRATDWKLTSVYWYSLRDLPSDVDGCGFCDFTGLLDADGKPKPAWRAFREQLNQRVNADEQG